MATTVSAWAKPGAWALDSEEHESELVQLKRDDSFNSNGNGNESGDYPSLAAAAAAPKSKKKSKGQTLSLQEFYNGPKQPASQSKGLTPDELLSLPTAPRQRTAEELAQSKGFRSYGTRDEQPRRQREPREFMPPASSRADEVEVWGKAKISTPNERRERRDYFPDSQSRADEVDNWAANKAFVPSDRKTNERRSFETNGGGGRADSDNWAKRKEGDGRKFGPSGGAFDSLRERRGGGVPSEADSDNWLGRKREDINNGGGDGSRPRLVLQPRTLPLESNNVESLVKPKGSSPFGDARPREEVLKEKGQDWKEIEEKLESVKNTKETPGEERETRRRGFGSGSWKGSPQDRGEQAWRKPAEDAVDPPPTPPLSAENKEDGTGGEAEDKEPQM